MSQLWAISSYFNPMRYERRLSNYRMFRKHLNVPLITVEWAWGDADFQLGPGDADVLLQVRSPDLLWQKERLMNIALGALPAACRYVAWLDCDVVFADADWPRAAARMLDDQPIIHLFDDARDVDRDKLLDATGRVIGSLGPKLDSMVAAKARGVIADDEFQQSIRLQGYALGFAWAARRDLLDRHPFYDACVAGSGNRVMICAAYGLFDQGANYVQMTPRWRDHYLAWAHQLCGETRGRVGYLPGQLLHLWHGDLKLRQYMNRHRILREADFDPATDLAIDAAGCWRWNSDKPTMHTQLRDYFASRREDG